MERHPGSCSGSASHPGLHSQLMLPGAGGEQHRNLHVSYARKLRIRSSFAEKCVNTLARTRILCRRPRARTTDRCGTGLRFHKYQPRRRLLSSILLPGSHTSLTNASRVINNAFDRRDGWHPESNRETPARAKMIIEGARSHLTGGIWICFPLSRTRRTL
jgi:hypothetical protein